MEVAAAFGRRVTRLSGGERERYAIHLPEADNEEWRRLRGKQLTVYVEAPPSERGKLREAAASGRHGKLALKVLESGPIVLRGWRVAASSAGGGRERYVIYLPEAYNDAWRLIHEAGARVNVLIEAEGQGEARAEPPGPQGLSESRPGAAGGST